VLVLSDNTLPQHCLRATQRLIRAPQDHHPAEPQPRGLVRDGVGMQLESWTAVLTMIHAIHVC
jgi:hypothetical protein